MDKPETWSAEQKASSGNGGQVRSPAITLPKGGGAIRGMGEKFAANPVTGTGSMTVPIATSPGRSGFGPQLGLSYDSGAGNGAFGFGWSLSLPAITRKTDKGLPRYRDVEESDVYILSGAEDLVPVLRPDGSRAEDTTAPGFTIHRYRPRIEGLFARLERWTSQATGETHWRSTTPDDITTLYGTTAESRIADPADPARVFTWLICQSYDTRGNAIVYTYAEENSDGVDVAQVHEKNRTPLTRSANRYLKRIRYGNRQPNRDAGWKPTDPLLLPDPTWMFEVVFDYGEHDLEAPLSDEPLGKRVRPDPFSSYRAGFEVRTYRLCQRVLMFHHFPDEEGVGRDCLVRSTDFTYSHEDNPFDARNPIFSFLLSVTQSGYRRQSGGYLKKSLPPLEFEYSQPAIDQTLHDIDPESVENLPYGLDGGQYQWIDLDGEGLSGVLTQQADGWFYKRNLGPINTRRENGRETVSPRFAPVELVAQKPSTAPPGGGGQQLLDLAGDGQVDLVELAGPTPGFYERTHDERWENFAPFTAVPNLEWDNPHLKFVDLTGDGHADILVSEDEVFYWYPSLAEAGFGPPERVRMVLDEEQGPRLVLADGSQSIYLSDMSGDGLTDLVRIRNGEVCYWPNLGYGRFGAKVTMDNAPWFDAPDLFDERRVHLADIDGSGTTDILYLARDGVQAYFNQSGNGWSPPIPLTGVPATDDVKNVTVVDLLGNGTACLVWSSPLSSDVRRPMRYLDLMGGRKPHLLIKTVNNLGAETQVQYSPSTKFYLADKLAGKPWITRLPFPVHVVERVETRDRLSQNAFASRYAYHHGYFDGPEREFRGFGLVEQLDTEEFAALAGGELVVAANVDAASHVPPVRTRTWFHTGVHVGRDHVSNYFAGLLDGNDEGEYYREPGLTDAQARRLLLDDTVLPEGLSVEEEREACRALKGSMLRQEVYALDGTDKEPHPYVVTEENFTVRMVQPRGGNLNAVFFTHPREAITHHYERNPVDPRTQHALTLEVDSFGNVLRELAVAYGRRQPDASLPLDADRVKQTRTLVAYTENRVTNAIDGGDDYRTPLPAETRTYELTGFTPADGRERFSFEEWTRNDFELAASAVEIPYEQTADGIGRQKRLIEQVRARYRPDDLGASQSDPLSLLPLGTVESLALAGESYKLAFTPGLLDTVYLRGGQRLLPADPADVLSGTGADRGGYVDLDDNGHWWIPSGRVFYSPGIDNTSAEELADARRHFFSPLRTRDPFGQSAIATLDAHALLLVETRDPAGNRITVGGRLPNGDLDTAVRGNDYRVLQPLLVMDPNRNRAAVAFDTLGTVVGTAVMGKPEDNQGDSLDGFDADLSDADILGYLANPFDNAQALLRRATTRLVYDVFAYQRTKDQPNPQSAVVSALARETHDTDLEPGERTRIQHAFSYSDGFDREMQKKVQAEPGPAPRRDAQGRIVVGADGQPELTPDEVNPRWVGSGWTVFNNKGKPVRQYEPFFSDTHRFEFDVRVGVSPVVFYDPVERVVATLHPDHTWEKTVFDPWQQRTFDVNDTVGFDPGTDPDAGGFFTRLPDAEYLPTWRQQRLGLAPGDPERVAAEKAAAHADTPVTTHLDTLGRPFLTVAHNKVACPGHDLDGSEDRFHTRVEIDIEGNQREVRDAVVQNGERLGRLVMRYDHDLLGNRIHQASMEAGERWMLNDVTGQPIRAFDSRGHEFRSEYDILRRPLRSFVSGADAADPARESLAGRAIYGEQHAEAEQRNLRGAVYLTLDQAGAATTEVKDFKGNTLAATRRLAREYKKTLDWRDVDAAALTGGAATTVDLIALETALAPELEAETFTSRSTFDALNRPVFLTTPHTPGMQPSVIRPGYNEANLLERVDVNLHASQSNGQPVWTPFVADIDYDAKGQRMLIDYGNGVRTTYAYDPLTFRLRRLVTRRDAALFPDDCPQPPPAGSPGCQVQNLSYTYDPAGNITAIRDTAQQTIYFRNRRVEPNADYTYDALYRLIEATGREHLGQAGGPVNPPTAPDAFGSFHTRLDNPGDGNAMGAYLERYVYDAVGNFLAMQHRGSDPVHPGWTRAYTYNDASLLTPGETSNRLSSTTVETQNGQPVVEPYFYDAHGNMTKMPHLPLMVWDYRDLLQASSTQAVSNGGTPETTHYVYDASGQRVRKVTERQAAAGETPTRKDERIYLGAFEIYREYQSGGGAVTLERETLHVMDDRQRIALVETRTQGNDDSLRQLVRFQFSNHAGSTSLELDETAQIISYEEYTPYGSTSYQAVRGVAEVNLKQYRYTGMERDAESGLAYHNARYYAPWFGRWTATDPAGLVDGLGLYSFAQDNPVNLRDVSGTDSVGTLVEYKSGGRGHGHKINQLHFFPASIQKKINPGWSRSLSAKHKELVYIAPTTLHGTIDAKLRKYAAGIDHIRDEDHLLKIIHDIQDIWVDAGVPKDVVRDWSKSAFSTARKIGITKKPVPTRPSVLRRTSDGDISDATKPKSGLLGKVGKLAKPLAILQGVAIAGDAIADVFRGDFGKAANKIGSFAYDQTIGTVTDIASSVGDFVTDPLGLSDAFDALEKSREEQDRLLEEFFGSDADDAPAPVAAVEPPAPRKSARRDWALGVQTLVAVVALALSAPASPPGSEAENSDTTSKKQRSVECWVRYDFVDQGISYSIQWRQPCAM